MKSSKEANGGIPIKGSQPNLHQKISKYAEQRDLFAFLCSTQQTEVLWNIPMKARYHFIKVNCVRNLTEIKEVQYKYLTSPCLTSLIS